MTLITAAAYVLLIVTNSAEVRQIPMPSRETCIEARCLLNFSMSCQEKQKADAEWKAGAEKRAAESAKAEKECRVNPHTLSCYGVIPFTPLGYTSIGTPYNPNGVKASLCFQQPDVRDEP